MEDTPTTGVEGDPGREVVDGMDRELRHLETEEEEREEGKEKNRHCVWLHREQQLPHRQCQTLAAPFSTEDKSWF